MSAIYHAWWSDRMIASGCGTYIWATADGKRLETCYVTETPQQNSNWPDMTYLGEITHFVAPGRPPRNATRLAGSSSRPFPLPIPLRSSAGDAGPLQHGTDGTVPIVRIVRSPA